MQGMNWWAWFQARPVCFWRFKEQRHPHPLSPVPAGAGQGRCLSGGRGRLGWLELVPPSCCLPLWGPPEASGGQGMHTQTSKRGPQTKEKVRTNVSIMLLQAKRTRTPSRVSHPSRQEDLYYRNLLHYSRPGMDISVIGLIILTIILLKHGFHWQ